MPEVYRYVHEWEHDSIPLVFTTIPMIHVGLKSYYDDVNEIIDQFNHLLLEGVHIKNASTEFGRYKYLASEVNLKNQYDEIRIPNDITVFNIDMDEDIINKKIKKISLKEKIKLRTYKNRIKKIKERNDLLEILIEYCKYPLGSDTKLIDPKSHYQFKNRKKDKLDIIIENDRDDNFQEKMKKYIEENKKRKFRLDVGIMVGDSHMPAIYRILEQYGFKWKLNKKIYVM